MPRPKRDELKTALDKAEAKKREADENYKNFSGQHPDPNPQKEAENQKLEQAAADALTDREKAQKELNDAEKALVTAEKILNDAKKVSKPSRGIFKGRRH